MDNNTTKRMTLKELVESGMPFTEIIEYVRDRDFVRVPNSDPAKAIVPIQSKTWRMNFQEVGLRLISQPGGRK